MNIGPFVCFNLFAFLIGARDVASQILLSEKIDPVFMLSIYCWTTTIAALATNILWRGGSVFKSLPRQIRGQNFSELLYPVGSLGVSTLLAFLATLFGIILIGAPLFNLVEHALMPISTAFLAGKMFGDHVSVRMKTGLTLCIVGVFLFMGPSAFAIGNSHDSFFVYLVIGLSLAVGASVLTSLTSANQKKLVSKNFSPDEVLFVRFSVPSLLLILYSPLMNIPEISWTLMGKLIGVSLFGFALPLVFLCLGFLKSSLARFSAYLLLVPAYTFFLGVALIPNEAEKLNDPFMLIGIAVILCGYIIFEWSTFKEITVFKKLQSIFSTGGKHAD